MTKKYHVIDKYDHKHIISPKKVIDFSSRPEWWSCKLYKLELASLDKTNMNMDLCVKKAKRHILENLDNKSAEHQMKVFTYLQDNIPWSTYSDIWINTDKQIIITPFLWDEKSTLCFSANNSSIAKNHIITELNGLTRKDIDVDKLATKANYLMDKLAEYGIQVFDDSYFFIYTTNGGILDIIIGDFHDITIIDKKELTATESWKIKVHNRKQLEFAYQQLADDNVIKDDVITDLQHRIYGLTEY